MSCTTKGSGVRCQKPDKECLMPDDDDDDFLDGCDIDMSEDATDDETVSLMPLFAEALDPNSPVTVEEVATAWGGE